MNELDLTRCTLKRIQEENAKLLWNWRNQDFVRKMMFHSEFIDLEKHLKWLNLSLVNPDKQLYLFSYNKEPMGMITFSYQYTKNSNWGFYIGNSKAPKGMGTLLGITALNEFFSSNSNKTLNAQVLEFNTKSIFLHKKLGFVLKKVTLNKEKIKIYHFSINKSLWLTQRSIIERKLKVQMI